MKDRIAELIRMSYREVISEDIYTGTPRFGLEFDERKFAELVVQECIDNIKPTNEEAVLQYKWLNFYDKSKRLREHFGITL